MHTTTLVANCVAVSGPDALVGTGVVLNIFNGGFEES